MKVKVTPSGIMVPRHLLPDVDEVDVRMEGGVVVIAAARTDNDPLLGLGTAPVDCGVPDGAENHDAYLYGGA
jgi:hypothetical protein